MGNSLAWRLRISWCLTQSVIAWVEFCRANMTFNDMNSLWWNWHFVSLDDFYAYWEGTVMIISSLCVWEHGTMIHIGLSYLWMTLTPRRLTATPTVSPRPVCPLPDRGTISGLDDVFPPDDLSSGPYTQSIIRLFFFLYIKLMCPYFILLIYTDGERDGLWMACPFRTLVVLYRMFPFIICLILLNYLMEFYFIGFVNAHLPGCFCPWTFRLNIGLNTSPSDSFVSYLNSHLGYSAGEFQALQLIVLAVFGAVD